MCGIVGAFHYGQAGIEVSAALLTSMRDTLRHRGPDDAGSWINPTRRLGLGHRRLSIIDLSANARQPMANETQTLWLTFNGEVYNHAELRQGLIERGHRFRSAADTEVVLHLYEESGKDCLRHLDGMFAFGLWDEANQTLFLARDRVGVKPLYYTCQKGFLLFASEIKALLAHPLVGRDLDLEALYHYLTFKTTPAPLTLIAGIRKLPAGHWLTHNGRGDCRIERYWDLARAPKAGAIDGDAAAEQVRALLDQAVAKRALADVPTGVFLSGGLDSSAVVALLAPRSARPVNTFSIAYDDGAGAEELAYARQVAQLFGTNHQEFRIGAPELEQYVTQELQAQDEPLADPVAVPLYHLALRARASGVVVVQTGEGSDEQFLGYDSRVQFLRAHARRWQPLLSLPRPLLWALFGGASLAHTVTGSGNRLRRVLGQAARGDELFWGSVAFSEDSKRRLLDGHSGFDGYQSQSILKDTLAPLRAAWPGADAAARVSYFDLRLRLADLLLPRLDRATMAASVEAREPFLDYRLVEFVLGLPSNLKLQGGEPKHLLKRALAGVLPSAILRRPKQPFAAPVCAWLSNGLADVARRTVLESRLRERGLFHYDMIEDLFEEAVAGRTQADVKVWTLISLSAWYDHWIAGAPVAAFRSDGGRP